MFNFLNLIQEELRVTVQNQTQDGQDSGGWFLVAVVVNLGRWQVERIWRQEDSQPIDGRLHDRWFRLSQQYWLPTPNGTAAEQGVDPFSTFGTQK